jgi:hypothetical protein
MVGAKGLPEWKTIRPNADPFLSILRARARNFGDFRPIFAAAQTWRHDPTARAYDWAGLAEGRSTFVYTPFAAMLVYPLTGAGWSVRQAADVVHSVNRLLWLVGGLMLFAILTYGQTRTAGTAAVFAVAYLAYYPIAKAIDLTQAQVWIWFFLVSSAFLLQRQHAVAAGIALGLGISIKPHLIVVPLLLGLTKPLPRRLLGACAATSIGLGLVALAWVGWNNLADYLFNALPALSSGYAYYRNQSINGLLLRLGGYADPVEFKLAPLVPWVRLTSTLFAVAILAMTAYVLRRRVSSSGRLLAYAVAVSAATIASPIAWTHHFSSLSIGLCLLARYVLYEEVEVSRRVQWLGFLSFLLTGCYFDSRFSSGFPLGLLSAFEFYGALILLACLVAVTRSLSQTAVRDVLTIEAASRDREQWRPG